MRRPLLLLLVALTVLGGGPAHASEDMTSLTNADRKAHGLAPLTTARDLQQFAQRRAEEMARTGELAHTENLGDKIKDWERLGENVGRGPYLKDIERGFMASDTHRHNILFRTFSEIGTGVASDGRLLYVAVVYREPEAVPPPAPRRPALAAPTTTTTAATPPTTPTTMAVTAEPPTPAALEAAPAVTLTPEPAPAPAEAVVPATTPTTMPPAQIGPVSPDADELAVADATKAFQGYELADRRSSGGSSGGARAALLSALAVGAVGLTAAERRRRRAGPATSGPAEAPVAPAAVVVAAAPARQASGPATKPATARPKPAGGHKPSARVGQHKSGRHRSKSKRKRR